MNQPIGDYGLNDDDVRSRPHNGLKSDIAPCPKSANSGNVSLNHFVSASPQRWWHRTTESVWPSDAQLCCQFQDTINAGAF